MDDLERIYDMLDAQNRTMAEQGTTLATIAQSMADTRERLFGGNGQPGALHYLQTEIDGTNATVAKHTQQLSLYRGGLAVLAFLWTGAVALGSAVLHKRH